jgi:hypothetical protein
MATRWLITVIACWAFAAITSAQPARIDSIDGVYNGSYAGGQGPTKFKLTLAHQNNGTLVGEFTLYVAAGSTTDAYTCDLRGRYVPANRMVQLLRGKWKTSPPVGIDMPGMIGVFDPAGGNGAGQISGKMRARPGADFEAIRDADESANLASVTAATKAAAPPPPVIAQQAPQPIAPKPAAPPPSASPVPAPAASGPTAINGVYTGTYQRSDGTSKLNFSIKATDDGSLTALFTFGPPNRHMGPSLTYKLTGRYNPGAHDQWGNRQDPFQFTTIEPMGSAARSALDASKAQAAHVGIASPGSIAGSLTRSDPQSGESNCGPFSATKDRTQPADLDQTMLAQVDAATAPAAPVVHPVFEGVYNGTYTSKVSPATKFKLMLWLEHEGKTAEGKVIKTDIGGLLTIFPTDGSGTMPCTGELKGFYGDTSRVIQLASRGWEPRMPGVSVMAGLNGKFDPGGGAAEISGYMIHPANPEFKGTRDAAESANMNVDRLREHIYPGIVGVFNGTYTRENEPPAKFKLTIKHNGDGPAGLAGMATVYLPSGSDTKPYTYDLKGVETPHGEFELRVLDWVSTPPADFKNFRAMGFNGKVVVNEAVTTAKMSSVPPPPSVASDFMPEFEATYDATESADIKGAIAAQKAIGSAEQAVALKARDEMIKNAPPKQLASKDLVRKSRQYWDGYQTDMIREVFDGGFGAAMDENEQFQRVFLTYVGTFSAECPECLPPNHQTVTVTEITSMSVTQNLGWREGVDAEADRYQTNKTEKTYTVEMDPRFVAKFNQFHDAVNSPGAGLRGLAAIAQPGGAQRVLHDRLAMVTDMQKFFADHAGKSAAMRQLNENFLRAINGEPSLQQAGGKISGAEAESDKDLPSGRYARFVDGANAYFRERADANPTKFGHGASHETALCQRMAELYEFHMSREEDYYYANDFAGRFVPIMGQRASCPDPAWPQLHPDVEKAIAEIK